MPSRTMKHSSKRSTDHLWQEAQIRARQHARKTGIPFDLWLVQSQKILPFPQQKPAEPLNELYRAFRDELLS